MGFDVSDRRYQEILPVVVGLAATVAIECVLDRATVAGLWQRLHDYASALYSHAMTRRRADPGALRVRGAPPAPSGASTRPADRAAHPGRDHRRDRAMSAASWSGCWRATRTSRSSASSGRDRDDDPIGGDPPPPRDAPACDRRRAADRRGVDAVFLALPHGSRRAGRRRTSPPAGTAVIDLGPDFRLRDAADYPRWYGFEHPRPDLLDAAVYGLPELHRAELEALVDAPIAIVGSPGLLPDRDAPRPGARSRAPA